MCNSYCMVYHNIIITLLITNFLKSTLLYATRLINLHLPNFSISVVLVLYSLPDPPRLEGPLKPNSHLHIAERLYEGKVLGPESIVFDHGGSLVITSKRQWDRVCNFVVSMLFPVIAFSCRVVKVMCMSIHLAFM